MLDQDPLAKGTVSGDSPAGGGDRSRPAPDPGPEPIGQVFADRYEIQEEIGAGAFAVTFLGRDLRLGRAVAIKVLRDTYAINPTFVQRFEREARAAAAVSHGNVVDVYDVGRHGDLFYIVMQYVKGEDLKHLIAREGPLPQRRAARITLQILAGLAAIHKAGIIHRDIKPQNVLIGEDGIARVTDFGIAHVTVEAGLTTAGTTFGTATYMAPEQAEAGPVVEATDLYSVGIVLYEMLTARLPFEAPTMIALILAHLQAVPAPPSARAPELRISPELDAVVLRALEKRPDDRFEDAPAMARAVSAALTHPPVGGEPTRAFTTGDEDTVRTTPPRSRPAAAAWAPGAALPATQPALASRRPRQANRARWLLPLVLLLLLLAGAAGGGAYLRSLNDGDDSPDDGLRGLVANLAVSPTSSGEATEAPTEAPLPTEAPPTATPVPTEAPTATAEPTPTDTPIPTEVPTATAEPTPTDTPEPTPAPTLEPAPTDTPEPLPTEAPPMILPRDTSAESEEEIEDDESNDTNLTGGEGSDSAEDQQSSGTQTLSFTAADWQGAYYQETGNLQPWAAIYAQGTGYGSATLRFNVDGTPATESFTLTVDGMTSENWPEVPMALLINGEEVYEGTSPFPTWNGIEGEQSWATVNVDLPTSPLQPGDNTVTFVNLVAEGEFSRPPYILLAGGSVTIETGPGG